MQELDMSLRLLLIALCLIGGVTISLQTPLASLMSTHIGVIQSAFIVNVGGAIASGLVLFLIGFNLNKLSQVPWYAICAGVLGVIVISVTNFVIPHIGVASTLTLIIAGQLVAGMVIDRYGLFNTTVRPFDLYRLAGLILISGGAWLILRK
jgi:bacterial/archaeal transporter family-2 protein